MIADIAIQNPSPTLLDPNMSHAPKTLVAKKMFLRKSEIVDHSVDSGKLDLIIVLIIWKRLMVSKARARNRGNVNSREASFESFKSIEGFFLAIIYSKIGLSFNFRMKIDS